MNVDIELIIIKTMASNENLEMYMNTIDLSKNIVRQEEDIYDNVSDCKSELATEKNDANNTADQATAFSLTCKKHVQPILIGVLYAIVLASIFWNVYSEENRRETLMSVKQVMENIKKDLEDSLNDLEVTNNKSTITFWKQHEKIVNMERKMEVVSDTMANNSIVSENTKSLMNMKAVVENIKKDLEESTSSVYNIKGVVDEINTRFKDLSGKVADLEKEIKDLKSQTIAFNVMDAVNFADNDVIKFSNIILNEGNAYNTYTGIFKAPVDGIYQFNAHICCKIKKDIEYFIKVEATKILTGEFRASDGATDTKCTSFSAAALVRKGENVWVGGTYFSYLDRRGNDDLSSFSGTLIKKI